MNHLRKATALAALAAGLAVSLPTIAFAAAPVAVDDLVQVLDREPVTVTVLDNDSFEGFATITDTQVVESAAGHVLPPRIGGGRFSQVENIAHPDVKIIGDAITVDFGDYSASQPGLRRRAVVEYTMRTDAGEQATGLLTVIDQRPMVTPVAHADSESPFYIGETGLDFRTHTNDEFSWLADVTLEVVSQPVLGRLTLESGGFPVSWRYTPVVTDESEWGAPFTIGDDRVHATDERSDEFTYRLCEAGSCSDPASVTLTYRAIERLSSIPRVPARGWFFWEGGPNTFSISNADLTAPAPVDLTGTTVTVTGSEGAAFTTATVEADGSITITEREPAEFASRRALPAEPQQVHLLDFRASDGTLVARGSIPVKRAQPYTDFTLADDEAWVVAGQSIPIRHLANDEVPFNTNLDATLDTWVGAPPQSWRRTVGDGDFGRVTGWLDPATGGTDSANLHSGERLLYEAGNAVGEDLIDYTVCAPYPTDASCKTATARIHVRPPVDAIDDAVTTEPGNVVIDVAANDVFTDIPSRAAEFTLDTSSLPSGVSGSMVGRQMTLEIPESLRGSTISVDYSVTDFSGTDRAVAHLAVPDGGGAPVTQDPTRSTAVDDYITIEPFTPPVRLDILSNDSVEADATVTLGDSPDGLFIDLDDHETVEVAATIDVQGQTIEVPYTVTDSTGTASAVIHVTVLDPDPVAPDAVDDVVTLVPGGDLIQVDVLGNDVYDLYGDGPRISLLLAEEAHAAGLTILTGPGGGVLIAADESLGGTQHVEPYVLTDTAGSDQANIFITVLPLNDPDPEPQDPPDARDDCTTVQSDAPRTIRLLTNDKWMGEAVVSVINSSIPPGLAVSQSPDGRVQVTADKTLEGRTLAFRYRLRDDSGLVDVARVTVEVEKPLIVVTGTERTLPQSPHPSPVAQAADAATNPVALATGAFMLLLGSAVFAASRRRSAVAR